MKYQVSVINQAVVEFNSFDRAFEHLRGQMYMTNGRQEVRELVDNGEVFRTVYGFYYGEMKKVA